MIDNIKKMKNITGNLEDCDNSTSKSSLTCTTSTNEEMKINSNCSINNNCININDQPKKNKKKLIFIQKNETKEKNENNKDQIDMKNDLLINFNFSWDDKFKDWPNSLFEIMPRTLGLTLKHENINFENEKFFFQRIPDSTEKEIDFSLKNKGNFLFDYNFNEKNVDIDENEDCSSRITNLYLQEYEDKNY